MGPPTPLHPITSVELSSAIGKLRKGKVPGHDALTAGMLKALDAYSETKVINLLLIIVLGSSVSPKIGKWH